MLRYLHIQHGLAGQSLAGLPLTSYSLDGARRFSMIIGIDVNLNTGQFSCTRPLIATVGLGVSDFGYRIFVSVVSCMVLEHGFGTWIQCTGMAIAKEKRETAYQEDCIYTPFCTAIALQSIRLFQSLLQKHYKIPSETLNR